MPNADDGRQQLACPSDPVASWADAVRERIASTVADPRRLSVWLATRALLRCIAHKRREFAHEGHDVVWLTQRYLLGVEGVTVHAAWSTWQEILQPLVEEGVVVRLPNLVARSAYHWVGGDGGYPPRLWVLPDALRSTARALLAELAPDLLNGVATESDVSSGDWRVVVPLRAAGASGWQACRCPWHDDRRPSAAVLLDAPGSGSFVCHACPREDGRAGAMTAWVVRAPDGAWVARRTDAVRDRATTTRPNVEHAPVYAPACVDVDAPSTDGHHVDQMVADVLVRVHRTVPVSASRLDYRVDGAGVRHPAALRPTGTLAGSLVASMRRSDARSTSDRVLEYVAHVDALREARWQSRGVAPMYLHDPQGLIADRLYAVSDVRTEVVDARTHQQREHAVSVSRVLFDLDDLVGLTPTRLAASIEQLRQVLDAQTCLGGEWAIVQTSPTGVQVVVDLAATRTLAWVTSAGVAGWHDYVGRLLVSTLRENGVEDGHADPCALQALRHGRRPGWRQLEDGSLFRARLVASGNLVRPHATEWRAPTRRSIPLTRRFTTTHALA